MASSKTPLLDASTAAAVAANQVYEDYCREQGVPHVLGMSFPPEVTAKAVALWDAAPAASTEELAVYLGVV